ncbi:MAG: class I SAM-dependent methyltransferase [Undibacterium sp.]
MHEVTNEERELLIRDKYDGDRGVDLTKDLARLESGEPLAYVIGWIPFLGLSIGLSSRPLIPRPETEWWTEELIASLRNRFGANEFSFLDMCAGSGAIGLAVLNEFSAARVAFAELMPAHVVQIRKPLRANDLDESRATMYESDLFSALPEDRTYDIVATNPPYVPEGRPLEQSVTAFEPSEALYAGKDGLAFIRSICKEMPPYIEPSGEVWMECDIENIEEAKNLMLENGATEASIRTDLYGRPRILVGYYA